MNIMGIDTLIKRDVYRGRKNNTFAIKTTTAGDVEKLAKKHKAFKGHIIESAVELLKKVSSGECQVVNVKQEPVNEPGSVS